MAREVGKIWKNLKEFRKEGGRASDDKGNGRISELCTVVRVRVTYHTHHPWIHELYGCITTKLPPNYLLSIFQHGNGCTNGTIGSPLLLLHRSGGEHTTNDNMQGFGRGEESKLVLIVEEIAPGRLQSEDRLPIRDRLMQYRSRVTALRIGFPISEVKQISQKH